jgi:hypothetical protein
MYQRGETVRIISTVDGANGQRTYPGWGRPANKQREGQTCKINEWTAELAARKGLGRGVGGSEK